MRTSARLILNTEPANITDALENADMSSSSPAERLSVRYDGSRKTVAVDRDAGTKGQAVSTDGLDCKFDDESDFGLDVTGGSIDWVISSTLTAELVISSSVVQEFSVAAVQSLDLNASTGSLEFSSVLSGTVTCELEIDPIQSKPVWLKVFSFQLSLNPSVGWS